MEFFSSTFYYFLFFVLAFYYLAPKKNQTYTLIIASLYFYYLWSWKFLLVLFVLILSNYLAGSLISTAKTNKKIFLWLGILGNVASIAVFKYSDFFVAPFQEFMLSLGFNSSLTTLSIRLPIGLSFLILQAISYLVDIYRGHLDQLKFKDFLLFMFYFPKLLSGPIERAREFVPQLYKVRVIDNKTVSRAVYLILLGLFRKVVLSELLVSLVPLDFPLNLQPYSTSQLLVFLFGNSFSLYNDFAGYSLIARGTSELFGIRLSQNFRTPYFMVSITDFWTRWHVSLSEWIREYLFMPLSRWLLKRYANPKNILTVAIPPLIGLIVSGFWHGAYRRTILWGLIMGAYIVAERIIKLSKFNRFPLTSIFPLRIVSRILMYLAIAIPGLLFISDIPATLGFAKQLLNPTFGAMIDYRIIFISSISLLIDWAQYKKGEFVFRKFPLPVQTLLGAIAILALLLASNMVDSNPFVYAGF